MKYTVLLLSLFCLTACGGAKKRASDAALAALALHQGPGCGLFCPAGEALTSFVATPFKSKLFVSARVGDVLKTGFGKMSDDGSFNLGGSIEEGGTPIAAVAGPQAVWLLHAPKDGLRVTRINEDLSAESVVLSPSAVIVDAAMTVDTAGTVWCVWVADTDFVVHAVQLTEDGSDSAKLKVVPTKFSEHLGTHVAVAAYKDGVAIVRGATQGVDVQWVGGASAMTTSYRATNKPVVALQTTSLSQAIRLSWVERIVDPTMQQSKVMSALWKAGGLGPTKVVDVGVRPGEPARNIGASLGMLEPYIAYQDQTFGRVVSAKVDNRLVPTREHSTATWTRGMALQIVEYEGRVVVLDLAYRMNDTLESTVFVSDLGPRQQR